jgi:PAS domain S-box-containing protein
MSISKKLTIMMLLGILLPASVMIYINYNATAKIITSMVQANLKAGVQQRINYLERYTTHLFKTLTIMSQKEELKSAYKEKNERKILSLLSSVAKAHSFYDMFIISLDGTIQYTIKKEDDLHKSLNKSPLKHTKFAQAFQKVLQTQKNTIANFSYYEASQKYAAFLLVPIYDEGKLIAVLAAQEDIDIFMEISSDYSGLGKTGEIVFLQKEDTEAVIISKLRNDKGKIFSHYVSLSGENTLPIQKAVNGEFGQGIYDDYEDIEVIASWGYIKSFQVGMVIKIDTSEAYEKIVYLKNLVLIMGFVILFVILYLVWHIRKIVRTLDEKKVQYEYAINGSQDGLWDWNLVTNELYLSPRLKEMLGYSDEEMPNALESWERVVHPDDYDRAVEFIAQCHKNPDLEYKIEYRAKHKDGSWVWILDRGETIFKDAKAVRMVGFHTDITQQKKLEEQLRKSQETFEQFMRYMPVSILILQDRKIVYANQYAKSFFGEKSFLGKTAADIHPKELADRIHEIETRALEEKIYDTLLEIEGPKGERYVKNIIAFSMEESVKGRQGIISLDITERFNTQKALEEKEEIMIAQSRHAAMGEMISMIAHQWRQPISVISMDANNVLVDIELDALDSESLQKDIVDILDQTKYLSKTIDDFRNFFKPSKTKDEVVVSNVFEESLAVIVKSLENNNIEVINDFQTQTVLNLFSRELLQVFINILNNAKEALVENKKDERKITNRIYEDEKFVIISICDNAGGIPEDVKNKIFEPYFTTKESKNGTGLGLYMSKIIIEKHLKGSIIVIDNSEGVCFEIHLPKINTQDE